MVRLDLGDKSVELEAAVCNDMQGLDAIVGLDFQELLVAILKANHPPVDALLTVTTRQHARNDSQREAELQPLSDQSGTALLSMGKR